MANQINLGNQNTQQIGHDPINQSLIPPISEKTKPKVNYLMVLTLSLCAILLLIGLIYFYFGGLVKNANHQQSVSTSNITSTISDSAENNKQTKQTTITSIDLDWKQLRNDKYHYQINFPITPKVTGRASNVRIIYEDTSGGKPPFLASMDISLIGLLDEPIEKTASRIAPSELFEKTTINGNQAIKINYKNTYSENPAIYYGAILVRNSQNLNFLIRIDTNVDNKYKELLEKSIQSFQFVDQKNLVTPHELLLSGQVSLISGVNLSPGTYSVYVDDNGKETCSGGDGYANMCSVTLYESAEEQNPVISHATL